VVDLENSSILYAMMFTNAESDGWGAEDMAKDAVVEFLPVLIDLLEQQSKCLHRPLRLVQQSLNLDPGCLSLLNVDCVGALLSLLEFFNLLSPAFNCDPVLSDPKFELIDETGESSPAEQEDVSRRPTGVANVVDVSFLGPDEDVTARKAQELVAATTFGEVKGHRPLGVGPGLGRDAKAEGRCEGTNDVDEWVQVTGGFEKLRTDLVRVEGLAEVDVDVGDLVVLEKDQDDLGRVVGNRSGGRIGEDASPNGDRTDDRFLSLALFLTLALFFLGCFVNLDLLKTNDVYRREADLVIPVSKLYDMMDIN
jgi:hypothetical protein